jgi:hypothetical protein
VDRLLTLSGEREAAVKALVRRLGQPTTNQ